VIFITSSHYLRLILESRLRRKQWGGLLLLHCFRDKPTSSQVLAAPILSVSRKLPKSFAQFDNGSKSTEAGRKYWEKKASRPSL